MLPIFPPFIPYLGNRGEKRVRGFSKLPNYISTGGWGMAA